MGEHAEGALYENRYFKNPVSQKTVKKDFSLECLNCHSKKVAVCLLNDVLVFKCTTCEEHKICDLHNLEVARKIIKKNQSKADKKKNKKGKI